MQFSYYSVFLDKPDHILGLPARIVYLLFTPGGDGIYRLKF
jgi:hypothetical protein